MINESTVEDVRRVFDAQNARRWVVAQRTALLSDTSSRDISLAPSKI
jgi:hypothetical protein